MRVLKGKDIDIDKIPPNGRGLLRKWSKGDEGTSACPIYYFFDGRIHRIYDCFVASADQAKFAKESVAAKADLFVNGVSIRVFFKGGLMTVLEEGGEGMMNFFTGLVEKGHMNQEESALRVLADKLFLCDKSYKARFIPEEGRRFSRALSAYGFETKKVKCFERLELAGHIIDRDIGTAEWVFDWNLTELNLSNPLALHEGRNENGELIASPIMLMKRDLSEAKGIFPGLLGYANLSGINMGPALARNKLIASF